MDKLVDFLKKNIQKNKLKGCGWSYTVDLRNSCISSEQYHLFNAVFSGEGNIEDLVKVHVNYYIHDIHSIQTRFKILRGLQKAIEYVWSFPQMYLLCLDCCQLIKKDQECEECIFYKTFMQVQQKKQTCGICQEECFRTMLSCNHYFHRSCLIKMDPENLKCPLCRHPFDENLVIGLFESEDINDDSESSETVYVSDLEEC